MKSVKIAQFKSELAKYLRFVRKGEDVVVTDRDTPIARVIPFEPITKGSLEIEEPTLDPSALFNLKMPPIAGGKIDSLKALLAERGDH